MFILAAILLEKKHLFSYIKTLFILKYSYELCFTKFVIASALFFK